MEVTPVAKNSDDGALQPEPDNSVKNELETEMLVEVTNPLHANY